MDPNNAADTPPPPPPQGIHCTGCDDFSCVIAFREWPDIIGDEAAKVLKDATLPHAEREKAHALVDADKLCKVWLNAHSCLFRSIKCSHADGTFSDCEIVLAQGIEKWRCKKRNCRKSWEVFAPLPISTKLKAYKVLILFFCFIKARSRKDVAESTGFREGTVCSAFFEFEKLFATEQFYFSANINDTLAKQEADEIQSGVRDSQRQHFQADETTWGATKYGRGKPTHAGDMQWFQTIVQVVNIQGKLKYKDFAIFPVADRKRITLFRNIHDVVPRSSKIRTDCLRAYVGF